MKKVLLIIIILITSCELKKGNPSEKKETKSELEIFSSNTENSDQIEKEKFKLEINSQYSDELSKSHEYVDAVTDFNGKKEFWRISEGKKGKKIIIINSHDNSLLYEEVYFYQNYNELIYARESIMEMPVNHFVILPWACNFYFNKGKLVTYESIGHGKTETDEWEPESIFEMFKNRLTELKNISTEVD